MSKVFTAAVILHKSVTETLPTTPFEGRFWVFEPWKFLPETQPNDVFSKSSWNDKHSRSAERIFCLRSICFFLLFIQKVRLWDFWWELYDV